MYAVLAALDKSPNAAAEAGADFNDVLDPYMWVFFAAFLVCFAATPLMRWLAVRSGIVDWPDLQRKAHIEPVAYLGGVALFLGWAAGLVACLFVAPHTAGFFGSPESAHISFPVSIFIGAAIIAITGLCDDVYGISPRVKIGGQLLAAAALATQDLGTKLVAQSMIAIGVEAPDWLCYLLGAAVIAIFIIGGCNSMNLLDGLDGLATGVASIACMGFLFIATFVAFQTLLKHQAGEASAVAGYVSDPVRIVMCLAILGALLGFLPYNYNPATIFMGDAGSLLVGYLCAATILLFADVRVTGPLLVMAALIVFALPISDTALAIFRRLMRRQPIFSPDSQHMHHMLIRSGMTVRRAVMWLYALAAFFAVLGCSLVFMRWRYVIAVFLVIFGFVLVTAYKVGHRQLMRQKLALSQHAALLTPPAGSAARSKKADDEDELVGPSAEPART